MNRRSLAVALGFLVAIGVGAAVRAADYTAQEKANIATIRGLFEALNAAEARGDQAAVIDGIAEKYLARDFRQYGRTPRDRAAWVALFKGNPGAAPASPGPAAALPPSRELAIMAEGDRVGHTASRDGGIITYHLFRLKDGLIVEEW